jgi:acyl CoA:acetate/3-ketoacid CoA transferase alpha subunit
MDKVVASAADAVADIGDGSSPAVGGFGPRGAPPVLISGLDERGTAGITAGSNCGYASGGTFAGASPAREVREIGGREYVLEEGATTDQIRASTEPRLIECAPAEGEQEGMRA